ncbi:MAG: nucleoside-diphosphate sugar epimerase/dehydratase [Pseudomonadota bacterium]
MVALAWLSAYLIRYNFTMGPDEWLAMGKSLVVVLLAQGLMFWRFGLYRSVWRFASLPDLWNIIRAVLLGVLAAGLVLFLLNRFTGIPRASFALYPLFLVFLLGAPRALYRVWKDYRLNISKVMARQRVLIVGAGRAGEMLARDMRRDNDYLPVGFVDDQRRLRGAKVHGLPVLGTVDELPALAAEVAADIIVIAIPSANAGEMRRVVERCEQAGLPFRTLPRLDDLMLERASVLELREVALEDLLGRDPIALDWRQISAALVGKTVLVTGAGGSIGSELCRQIARVGPTQLVIFERCEFNLYSIELELRRTFPELLMSAHLGDITDPAAVDHVFNGHRPQMVFHAAAYKHVPMLQEQPREAVRNNVIGTRIVALAADKFGVETVVMISTDKAVNPTNVMGASKRVAELYCQALSRRSKTRFITVRFGNVLGSAGSVVPLFQQQIAAGGPVTVTHPDIARYFMTLPEASQLIMQAAAMGEGGEIFVLEMGQPIKIRYLAEQLIRLSGKTLGKDIDLVFTGLRPGEKLYEELFYAQEQLSKTANDKILLAQSSPVEWERLSRLVEKMDEACQSYDQDAQRLLLQELVPELRIADEKARTAFTNAAQENVIHLNRYNA